MPNVVYIITRNRYANLKKIIPRWLDQDFKVVLVVDPAEYEDHVQFIRNQGWWLAGMVEVSRPMKRNGGVGYQRKWAVVQASLREHSTIIMSDDDIRPAKDSDMSLLIEAARNTDVLGIGAARSIHNHFTKGAISRNKGQILCPSGLGFQLFSLNIANTIDVGGFDPRLDCFGEDAELMRRGIASGIPWRIHCDVWCEPIGPRYAPGGLMAYAPYDRQQREIECRRIIHERWPAYTSKPEARPRMAWKRFYDDMIPGWQNLSAIHGGALSNGTKR